jgi:hypothetical protein
MRGTDPIKEKLNSRMHKNEGVPASSLRPSPRGPDQKSILTP